MVGRNVERRVFTYGQNARYEAICLDGGLPYPPQK